MVTQCRAEEVYCTVHCMLLDLGKYILVTILLEWVKDVKSLMLLDSAVSPKQRAMLKDLMSEYANKFENILKWKQFSININAFRWLLERGIGGLEIKLCESSDILALSPFATSVAKLTIGKGILTAEIIPLLRHFVRLQQISVDINSGQNEILSDLVKALTVHHSKINLIGNVWTITNRVHLMAIMHAHLCWNKYAESRFVRKAVAWYCQPALSLMYNIDTQLEALTIRSLQPDSPLTSLSLYVPATDAVISQLFQSHPELERLMIECFCSSEILLILTKSCVNLTSLSLRCHGTIDYSCLHASSFRLKSLALRGEADGVIPTVWTDAFLNIQELTIEDNSLSLSAFVSFLGKCQGLTALSVRQCNYEMSVFASLASGKFKRLEWDESGSMESFFELLRRTSQSLLHLQVNLQHIRTIEMRNAVFHSLPRLQSLGIFTNELTDSDFTEDWVQETVELFRPRLCELALLGWGCSETRSAYEKEVYY